MSLISLIITEYNQSKFVPKLCDCLAKQNLEGIELIFTDDHSTDDTVAVLREEVRKITTADSVRIRSNPENMYAGGNRNAAAVEARGEYIWFFDGDDLFEPGSIAKVRRKVEELRPECLYVGWSAIDRPDRQTYSQIPSEINPWAQSVLPPTKIIRRDLFRPFKLWKYFEDFEWWFRQTEVFTEPPTPYDEKVLIYDKTTGISWNALIIGREQRSMAEWMNDMKGMNPEIIAERLEQNASLWRLYHYTKNPNTKNAIRIANTKPWLCMIVI